MSAVSLQAFSQWLSRTTLSHIIQTVTWMIPTIQIVHILSIGVLFSSALLINLRLWRLFEPDQLLDEVMRRFAPVIWTVLLILLASGSLLIIAEPRRSLQNDSFYLKMGLLVAALLVTAMLQRAVSRDDDLWEKSTLREATLRGAAVISTLLWCGVIFAGRWIAYTQAG